MTPDRDGAFIVSVDRGAQLEFEFLAERARCDAGLKEDDFADAVDIVQRVLGPMSIVYDRRMPLFRGREEHHQATYLRRTTAGAYVIVLPPRASDIRFRLLHEVGHVMLERAGYTLDLDKEERAANYIAAAIMAPASLVVRAHDYYGEKLRPLAKTFGLSQTAMQLRLGEVLRDERGVVTKSGNVFVRSQGAFPWAAVPVVEVARGAVADARLEIASLRGGIDIGRVALRVR